MKITKSIIEALAGIMAQPVNQHSSHGNVLDEAWSTSSVAPWEHVQNARSTAARARTQADNAKHPDDKKVYHKDAKDWDKIASHISTGNSAKAAKHWHKMDTAAKEGGARRLIKHLERHLTEEELDEAKSLESYKKLHAQEHEGGQGTTKSYAAMKKIELEVKKHYGSKGVDAVHASTEAHAMGAGPGRLREEELDEITKPGRFNPDGSYVYGRMYTDTKGTTHDDEGNSETLAQAHAFREKTRKMNAAPKTKHYHTVPFKDKEHAKGEGMKWDKDKGKWYHMDAGKSTTSKFKKLKEEVELVDESKLSDRPDANAKDNTNKTQGMYSGGAAKKERHRFAIDTGSALPDHFHLNVTSSSKENAKLAAIAHMRKQGKKVVSITHHSQLALKEDDHLSEEEKKKSGFDHRKAAQAGIIHPDAHQHAKAGQDHDFYSRKNGDKLTGKVHFSTKDRVIFKVGKSHEKDHGTHQEFKVGSTYDRMNEEGVEIDDVLIEGHKDRAAADVQLAAIDKKHPLGKHSVVQGRRSGAWHVVRHTSGGMHIVEDWKSWLPDSYPGQEKFTPKYAEAQKNVTEGDESEADYQAYLKSPEYQKSLKDALAKKKAKTSTIKNLVKKPK